MGWSKVVRCAAFEIAAADGDGDVVGAVELGLKNDLGFGSGPAQIASGR